MNDERSMILKMLQEGKITVEEADALLDVLNEPENEDASGFTAEQGGRDEDSATRPHGRSTGRHVHGVRPPSVHVVVDHENESEDSSSRSGDSGFSFDFDLSGLKDTLRSTMGAIRETVKGVSETVKDAFEGTDFNFEVFSDIGRRMGKVQKDGEVTLSGSGGEDNLKVAASWGDVTINGTDGDQVHAVAHISCWGATEEEAEERLAAVRVSMDDHDGGYTVKANEAARTKTRIDYEITVPRRFSVTASTASGNVRIEELEGSQSVSTQSGDVELSRLGTGPMDVQNITTKSGEIVGAELSGQIHVGSLAGDVSINGFTGFLKVSASSGDIEISEGRGSVQAKSLSGDVAVELEAIGTEPISVTALSGDVQLQLPESDGYDITAKTATGEVSVEFDLQNASISEKKVTGQVNGGGLPVEISTMSGDVQIDQS